MIGLFDSGHGGLSIYAELRQSFPDLDFIYLGDHGNAPYGDRPSAEILQLTQRGVEQLFRQGCRLVILACNTATAVALRELQTNWLPHSQWPGRNVLGIIAPTVEVATQTPFAVTTPQYPQKNNRDVIAVFGTSRTIASQVFDIEIRKRCPKVQVVSQACPELAGAIEAGAERKELARLIGGYISSLLDKTGGVAPDKAILGCTHYALVTDIFRVFLPSRTRVLHQPIAVASSLENYLERHQEYFGAVRAEASGLTRLITTGDLSQVNRSAQHFLNGFPAFEPVSSLV